MTISLRTRILLFLFLFALAPLLLAVVINLPLVLERVELFYRHAVLENLRAEFRDLDQHLASRDEMLRLLTKLPEPGLVLGLGPQGDDDTLNDQRQQIDLARARYTEWINRILADQLDIQEIVFLDQQGIARFWLSRDPKDYSWQPTTEQPPLPEAELVAAGLAATAPIVLFNPVRLDPQAKDPSRALTLQLIGPIGPSVGQPTIGLVAITIDIGGLVRRDSNSLWIESNGDYLNAPGLPVTPGNAFLDFPGLETQLAQNKITLWQGPGGGIIWVPLLLAKDDRAIWVGRPVDEQPLEQLRATLVVRVMSIVLALVLAIALASRWFARRMEGFGTELLEGIGRMLERGEVVRFKLRGGAESKRLSESLTALSESHAANIRNLMAHARELEASNRYKSQFLANVSHELRTPLNSILLLSKILAEKSAGLDETGREQARVIHQASRDLRGLIDNILDLSRIESGQLEVLAEEVELPVLLQDLVGLMRPQFDDKNLRLALRIDPEAPHQVRTDPDKVRQIVKNFLGNAVKFTAEGGAELRLSAARHPWKVQISVTDSGIGIPLDKQGVIFEAFKQADGSTSRRYGGTGLGLSISRQLAHALGGEISVSSSAGAGATFSLLLPVECGEQLPCPPPPQLEAGDEQTEPPGEIPSADFGGACVLLLDTDHERVWTLNHMLSSWNLRLFVAVDEDEALETLQEEPQCDLVLVAAATPDPCARIKIMRNRFPATTRLVLLSEPMPVPCESTVASLPLWPDAATLRDSLAALLGEAHGER